MHVKLRPILLVEDRPLDVELTLTELSAHHLLNEVIAVRDGERALEYLFRRGEFALREQGNPAVVLLDLRLPRMDGLEVLACMKVDPSLKDIPVIVLTTSHRGTDRDMCRMLGVEDYLTKPIDFHALIDCLTQLGLAVAVFADEHGRRTTVPDAEPVPA
jgi:CheY-like chemotaxis protein